MASHSERISQLEDQVAHLLNCQHTIVDVLEKIVEQDDEQDDRLSHVIGVLDLHTSALELINETFKLHVELHCVKKL